MARNASEVDCVALIMCIFQAPVSAIPGLYVCFFLARETVGDRWRLSFSRASTMLIPLMASRLMLSLKKTAMKPTRLSVATDSWLSELDMTARFASRAPRTRISLGFAAEDIALEPGLQPSQGGGYDHNLNPSLARSPSDGVASSPDPRV